MHKLFQAYEKDNFFYNSRLIKVLAKKIIQTTS